jgi:hypothetical protein
VLVPQGQTIAISLGAANNSIEERIKNKTRVKKKFPGINTTEKTITAER